MFRIKATLISAGIVLVATVAGFCLVRGTLMEMVSSRVDGSVEHAGMQLERSVRLDGYDLIKTVSDLAREEEMPKVFLAQKEEERRQAAFNAVEARRQKLAQPEGARKTAIIAIVDKDGKVVARDLNPNTMVGDDLKAKYASVGMALSSAVANSDVWNFDGQMYRAGVAPIRGADGGVVGALIVGYAQSVDDAQAEKGRTGVEVAYFLDGKIHASSFQRGEKDKSESAEEKVLAGQLFDGPKLADAVLADRRATKTFRVNISGEEWVAQAAPLPGTATKSKSGFVVLASLQQACAATHMIPWQVLLLGLIGLICVALAAVMTSRRFLVPLDKVEAGVTEVINGNHDYVFEKASPDFEGLANGLNVMMARLLGRPDPTDEDEGGGHVGEDAPQD